MIPIYGTIVAAYTTLLSEIVTVVIHFFNIQKIKMLKLKIGDLIDWKTLVTSVLMFLLTNLIYINISNIVVRISVTIVVGILTYVTLNFLFKNQIVLNYGMKIRKKICKHNR